MTRPGLIKKLRRVGAMDIVERVEYPCPVCKEPLYVAANETVKCHKRCKKEYRRILKYQHDHQLKYNIETVELEGHAKFAAEKTLRQSDAGVLEAKKGYQDTVGRWWKRLISYAKSWILRIYGKESPKING